MHLAGHCTVDVCMLVGVEWRVSHCQPRGVSSVGVVGSHGCKGLNVWEGGKPDTPGVLGHRVEDT